MDIILSRLVHLEYVLFAILFIHDDDDIVIDSHVGYNTQSASKGKEKVCHRFSTCV